MRRIVPALALALLLMGCASYYRVQDTNSGAVYYTRSVHTKRSGAATFKDAKTDARVTLQSSAVKKITKEEYEKAVGEMKK